MIRIASTPAFAQLGRNVLRIALPALVLATAACNDTASPFEPTMSTQGEAQATGVIIEKKARTSGEKQGVVIIEKKARTSGEKQGVVIIEKKARTERGIIVQRNSDEASAQRKQADAHRMHKPF